jgi:bla regulator protein blaR1
MSEEQRRSLRELDRLRLQSLLADRFNLKLRKESRQMPIYAMVVAKNGPKVQQAPEAEGRSGFLSGRGEVSATRVGMEAFAQFLGEQAGRPVLDMTGLKGNYTFSLKWSPDTNLAVGTPDATNNPPPPPDSSGPTLFTAIQDQLGLKLDPQKSPAEVLVVEVAEKPSEN